MLTFRLRYSRTREEETSSMQSAMAKGTTAFCLHANNKTPRSFRGDSILAFSNTIITGRYDITTTNVYQTFRFVSQCYMLLSNAVLGFGDVFPWRSNFFFSSSFIDIFGLTCQGCVDFTGNSYSYSLHIIQ